MEDYLIHYGVLGMKWGVRRYQNKDGTLTKAGQRRLAKAEDVVSQLKSGKKTSTGSKKSVKDMSDSELNDAITRLGKENQYLNLKRSVSSLSPQQVSKGKAVLSSIGKMFSTQIAPKLMGEVGNVAAKYVGESLKKSLGLEEKKKQSEVTKEAADVARNKYTEAMYTYKLNNKDYGRSSGSSSTTNNETSTESTKKTKSTSTASKKTLDFQEVTATVITNSDYRDVGYNYVRAFTQALPGGSF